MYYIGTSGWNYKHWSDGLFYPHGLSQRKWLEYYCEHFNTVELNVTFYRLPKEETFKGWYQRTPGNFLFIVKGSRFITHIKKMQDCKGPVELFISTVKLLKEKLGAVLWQFPPSLKKNIQALEQFFNLLNNTGIRQVFEMRHASWFDYEIFDILQSSNACLCIADSDRWPCAKEVTADFLYLRFHGRNGTYRSKYTDEQLREWTTFVKAQDVKDTFAYFNNDIGGHAVNNAKTFREFLLN